MNQETDEPDYVRLWAKVKADLNEARRRVLKDNGLSLNDFYGLERCAEKQIGTLDELDTEFGTIKALRRPVYLHKDAKQIDTYTKLILTKKED